MLSAGAQRREVRPEAYSTRLPLSGQRLQPLCVAELDENLDGPFVEVIVLSDVDLARTADTCVLRKDGQRCIGDQGREEARTVKGIRELLADFADKVGESRLPLVLHEGQPPSTTTSKGLTLIRLILDSALLSLSSWLSILLVRVAIFRDTGSAFALQAIRKLRKSHLPLPLLVLSNYSGVSSVVEGQLGLFRFQLELDVLHGESSGLQDFRLRMGQASTLGSTHARRTRTASASLNRSRTSSLTSSSLVLASSSLSRDVLLASAYSLCAARRPLVGRSFTMRVHTYLGWLLRPLWQAAVSSPH